MGNGDRSERLRTALRAVVEEASPNGHVDALHGALEAQFGRLVRRHARVRLRKAPDAAEGIWSAVWALLWEDSARLAREAAAAEDPVGFMIALIDRAAWEERDARIDPKRERHSGRLRQQQGDVGERPLRPPSNTVPMDARSTSPSADPRFQATARDEFTRQWGLIQRIKAAMLAIARQRHCVADARITRWYRAQLREQHREGVPLARMTVSLRRLASDTRFDRATVARRLPELLDALPPALRVPAPRPAKRGG